MKKLNRGLYVFSIATLAIGSLSAATLATKNIKEYNDLNKNQSSLKNENSVDKSEPVSAGSWISLAQAYKNLEKQISENNVDEQGKVIIQVENNIFIDYNKQYILGDPTIISDDKFYVDENIRTYENYTEKSALQNVHVYGNGHIVYSDDDFSQFIWNATNTNASSSFVPIGGSDIDNFYLFNKIENSIIQDLTFVNTPLFANKVINSELINIDFRDTNFSLSNSIDWNTVSRSHFYSIDELNNFYFYGFFISLIDSSTLIDVNFYNVVYSNLKFSDIVVDNTSGMKFGLGLIGIVNNSTIINSSFEVNKDLPTKITFPTNKVYSALYIGAIGIASNSTLSNFYINGSKFTLSETGSLNAAHKGFLIGEANESNISDISINGSIVGDNFINIANNTTINHILVSQSERETLNVNGINILDSIEVETINDENWLNDTKFSDNAKMSLIWYYDSISSEWKLKTTYYGNEVVGFLNTYNIASSGQVTSYFNLKSYATPEQKLDGHLLSTNPSEDGSMFSFEANYTINYYQNGKLSNKNIISTSPTTTNIISSLIIDENLNPEYSIRVDDEIFFNHMFIYMGNGVIAINEAINISFFKDTVDAQPISSGIRVDTSGIDIDAILAPMQISLDFKSVSSNNQFSETMALTKFWNFEQGFLINQIDLNKLGWDGTSGQLEFNLIKDDQTKTSISEMFIPSTVEVQGVKIETFLSKVYLKEIDNKASLIIQFHDGTIDYVESRVSSIKVSKIPSPGEKAYDDGLILEKDANNKHFVSQNTTSLPYFIYFDNQLDDSIIVSGYNIWNPTSKDLNVTVNLYSENSFQFSITPANKSLEWNSSDIKWIVQEQYINNDEGTFTTYYSLQVDGATWNYSNHPELVSYMLARPNGTIDGKQITSSDYSVEYQYKNTDEPTTPNFEKDYLIKVTFGIGENKVTKSSEIYLANYYLIQETPKASMDGLVAVFFPAVTTSMSNVSNQNYQYLALTILLSIFILIMLIVAIMFSTNLIKSKSNKSK